MKPIAAQPPQGPSFDRAETILRSRLSAGGTCAEVILAFENLSKGIWDALVPLIGPRGCRAVLARAVRLTAGRFRLISHIVLLDTEFDLSALREYAATQDCPMAELVEALIQLGLETCRLLIDLAADTLINPLLARLSEEKT